MTKETKSYADTPEERSGHYIITYSGNKIYFSDIRPEDIEIEDIAHSLSNVCRYTGHCKWFYSVAEHSVWASTHAPLGEALNALLHDAAEAFMCDMATPLKRFLDATNPTLSKRLRGIEDRIMTAVHAKFGGSWPMSAAVKEVDHRMLATEMYQLMPAGVETPYAPYLGLCLTAPFSPAEAKAAFLARFYELTAGR